MPRTSSFAMPPLLLLLPPAALSPPLVLTIRALNPQPSTAATTASAEVAPASNRTSADSLSSATSADSTPGRDLQAAGIRGTIECGGVAMGGGLAGSGALLSVAHAEPEAGWLAGWFAA